MEPVMEAELGKNILIFSDGTGQIGGVRPDQRLSNVYKMYRAMRPGPDSPIDPAVQVAFYDPGLGSGEGAGNLLQRIRNVLSSAFGTGISENIIDCYEAIVGSYEPGDRIFIFGFSRGAYTARCVANVLNLCGVPSKMPDGAPVPRSGPRLRRIAQEAVYKVFEHGSGKDRREYELEREELARRFRSRYGSEGTGLDGESQGNVAPMFVGVFDTVAALGSVIVRRILAAVLVVSLGLAAWAWASGSVVWAAVALLPTAFLAFTLIGAVKRQLKYIVNGPAKRGLSWHFAAWNLKHYDRFLDTNVGYARHALSIDENRRRFPRVPWGRLEDIQRMEGKEPKWLEQVWFAGNHSDIGGSYPESESRLSDVALEWMVQELLSIPEPPIVREELVRTFANPEGLQHDEVRASRDNWWPGWWPRALRFGWSPEVRAIHRQAKLHPAVLARFAASAVPHYDMVEPYRPEGLRGHEVVGLWFVAADPAGSARAPVLGKAQSGLENDRC